jgi:heme-degrading monooxygenase HmoA
MPTPAPPYYAVIFSSQRTAAETGYGDMAERMEKLAAQQPGFLGIESVRDASGAGVTVSYWTDREAIANWSQHVEHRVAQARGRAEWYRSFSLRICLVEDDRFWDSGAAAENIRDA